MLIRNLAGIFTCRGFAENEGRRPTVGQADFIRGPVDIYGNDETSQIVEIGCNLSPASNVKVIDGSGKIATPGFVDSHTHAVFAGSRPNEFFRRWAGQSYLEIAKAGGGIASTRRSTCDAEDDYLIEKLASRLQTIRASGTVAVEVKSGYGRSLSCLSIFVSYPIAVSSAS